jgi:hypothetical protein
MADLALVLFSLAVGVLIGFCGSNLHRSARPQHRPQRTPRTPWR